MPGLVEKTVSPNHSMFDRNFFSTKAHPRNELLMTQYCIRGDKVAAKKLLELSQLLVKEATEKSKLEDARFQYMGERPLSEMLAHNAIAMSFYNDMNYLASQHEHYLFMFKILEQARPDDK